MSIYHPERSGWSVAARKSALLLVIVVVAFMYGAMVAILPPSMLVGAAAPLGIIALLVIWALPDARSVPTRALASSFVFFLFCMIIWPNYLAIALPGLPYISVRRLVGLILSGLLLVCLSTSKLFRAEVAATLRASSRLAKLLFAYFLLQFIACVLSVSPAEAIGRWVNVTFTSTAVCFTAVWLFGPAGKSVEWFCRRIFIAVSVVMIIGALEARIHHVLWLNYISFLHMDPLVMEALAPHFRKWYRVVATYSTPLAYGELLALVTPFVIFKLLNAKTWKERVAFAAFDGFILYSAILSTARLATVGYLVAHAGAALLWSVHRWRKVRGDMTGVSLTMVYPALLVALVLAVTFVPAVHVRVLGGGAAQSSTDARSEQFHAAIPVIAKRPVFGYGIGEGAGAINWRTVDGFLSIDLGFVAMAADIGLVGLFAYSSFIVFSIFELVRRGLRSPAFTYPPEFAIALSLIVLITTRLVLAQPDNDPLFNILFGMALGQLWRARLNVVKDKVAHGSAHFWNVAPSK
ncbi:O-antigen ligase family protein [Sphingomonas elodea]|uniref:O-antigen ligase family protein n=1 Tax=Sphingomonas elodea TaxID=179878 RepID=UPI0002631356|nr:O-antigen ligase family protein [Sphingomonas elodea]